MAYKGVLLLVTIFTSVKQIYPDEVFIGIDKKSGSVHNVGNYMGESFPVKYLTTDGVVPTVRDLEHYINKLKLTMTYFANTPNYTDCNKSVGVYFTKGK